jgi:hypothetical protein
MISEHVSLAVAALQQVDAPARERIRAHAIAGVSAFEKDGKVRIPGLARCIVGTKQDVTGTRPPEGARSSNATGRPSPRPSRAITVGRAASRPVGHPKATQEGSNQNRDATAGIELANAHPVPPSSRAWRVKRRGDRLPLKAVGDDVNEGSQSRRSGLQDRTKQM